MPKKIFTDKVLQRLDKMDKEAIQNYVLSLEAENSQKEALIDELPVGTLLVNNNLDCIWSNNVTQNLLGSRIPKNKTIPLENIILDADFLFWIKEIIQDNRGALYEEKEVFFPKHKYLICTLRPLEDNFLIVLLDITAIRQKDKEEGQLQRISSLVKLSQGIAHELGNPLNSIGIHLRLLKKMCESLPNEGKHKIDDTLNIVIEETNRLDEIIKNFLKITRQKPVVYKLGTINTPLEEAIRFLEPELKESKIKTILELEEIPPFLFDRNKLYQAFLNIIKNSIDAMKKGGELKVKAVYKEKVCSILFQDSGEGIDIKSLDSIFEEYFTTKDEGSGLGLSIVYNIVKEHGGKIEVKSTPKKGSSFILYLPMRTEKRQLPAKSS